jgi:nucleotidyltransferase/DNA polymerase involved in DNA repair
MTGSQVMFLSVPGFGAAVARRVESGLTGKPLLLLDERGRVLAADAGAARAGVVPEMPERQAVARCPEAAVLPADRFPLWDAQESLLAQVRRFSDRWQPAGLGSAYLDASAAGKDLLPWCQGLADVVRRMGWEPALGATGSKFGASVAAQVAGFNAALLLVSRAQRAFLSTQPVAFLPLDGEAQAQLRYLGIRTLGQFSALPPAGILARFGPEGRTAQRWAQGQDNRPIVPPGEEPEVAARVEFDAPLDDRGRFLAALWRAADRLMAPVRERFQAISRIRLAAVRADGQTVVVQHTFPLPTAAMASIRLTVGNLMERLPIGIEGVSELALTLAGISDLPVQQLSWLDLASEAPNTDRARLDETLALLADRYGSDAFHLARLADAAHPLPERRVRLLPWH